MPGTNGHDEHPNLTEDEDKAQRGDNPPDSFGTTKRPNGDLDPNWKPSDRVRGEAEEFIKAVGREHRPRREDVLPLSLIHISEPTRPY